MTTDLSWIAEMAPHIVHSSANPKKEKSNHENSELIRNRMSCLIIAIAASKSQVDLVLKMGLDRLMD